MSISIISDTHAGLDQPKTVELLNSFLDHPQVAASDSIYLLGDIFEFMVGDHVEYLMLYKDFFERLKSLSSKGILIHYFEGNHDFHLKSFFERPDFLDKVFYHKGGVLHEHFGKQFYFSHGDDVAFDNEGYHVVRRILRSGLVGFLSNSVLPFNLIQKFGQSAVEHSRHKRAYEMTNLPFQERLKYLYRFSCEKLRESCEFDYLVCGHAHVQDHYVSETGFTYLNTGYSPQTRAFLWMEKGDVQFVPL